MSIKKEKKEHIMKKVHFIIDLEETECINQEGNTADGIRVAEDVNYYLSSNSLSFCFYRRISKTHTSNYLMNMKNDAPILTKEIKCK